MSESFVTNVYQYFRPKTKDNDKRVVSKTNNKEFDSIRKQLVLKTFNKIDSQITIVRKDLFSPLMQSLFQFVSNNSLNNKMKEKTFETKFKPNIGLIPTALISIGTNSSEYKFICHLLVTSIEDLTAFVVYLDSSETQTMTSVFQQIRDTILTEDVIETMNLDENQIKRLTFESVFKIYEEFAVNSDSNNFCPPIVLFFEEIENFDNSLITSLILIIKEYLQTIPFIIIIIKTNESTSLQHLLPSRATDYLLIHHFNSFSRHQMINKVIEELLIESSLPLKLSPNILDHMIKLFESFDFSIQNSQNFIKFCIFQHFYENDLSFLCQSVSELKSYLKNNDSKSMQALRDSQLFDFSLKTRDFNKSIINSIKEFVSNHKQLVNNLKVIQKLLNETNDEITLTKLYINFLNNSFEFKQIIESMNKLTQNQWKKCLENCLTYSSFEETEPLIDVLKLCQKSLNEIISDQQLEPQVVIERLDVSQIKNKLSNVKNRHQWKETINPLNKPKVLSKFEIWRKTTIESIEEVMNQIPNPMSNRLNKIVFFDDLKTLENKSFVVLRNDIHKSLSNPLIVGQNKSQKQIKTDFHRLFDIYSESQTVFNVFDAFVTFKELNPSFKTLDSNRKRTKKDETNDESIVSFINGVSNLEYIGLIQSAKHKTDHLMRLIWF